MIAQAMRAILLASATATSLKGFFDSKPRAQFARCEKASKDDPIEMAPKPLKYISFFGERSDHGRVVIDPLMFRFSYQFQIVAGDLNRAIVQSRFTIKRAMYGRAGPELLRARMMRIKLANLHTK